MRAAGGGGIAAGLLGLMNLAMIALHLPGPAHHHGGTVGGQPSPLMGAATLVALVEAAAAAVVLYVRSRGQYAALDAALSAK